LDVGLGTMVIPATLHVPQLPVIAALEALRKHRASRRVRYMAKRSASDMCPAL
jgi:hypothetical protein